MSLNDIIKQYSVQIKYEGSEGSGVIVKLDNENIDYFYILTAKHTFFEEELVVDEDALKNMDEQLIDKEKIKILDFDDKVICKEGEEKILSVIGIDKKYDFLLLKINTYHGLTKLKALNIFQKTFKSCIICGYPTSKEEDDNSILAIRCEFHMTDSKKNNYEVIPKSPNLITQFGEKLSAVKEMGGLSGSGVFFGENHDELSLVGIQVKAPSLQMLQCLDLREIVGEINEKLDIPILFQNEARREKEKIKQSHIIPRDGYIEPRTVYIDKLDIHVAVCTVTFEEYDLFCKDDNRDKIKDYGYETKRETFPIVNIKLQDAKEYCDWLYKKTDKQYRLLTSDEWDFLAEKSLIPKDFFSEYVWYSVNSCKKIQRVGTTPKVGELGIYDLYGNVHEWCSDKVIRGGSSIYSSFESMLRKDNDICKDNYTGNKLGFRIVVENNKN